jgi:WD40 repeat protein
VSDFRDIHSQTFLRAHDDNITCIRASESGKLFVTGQQGRNADVCVWNTASMTVARRICEHDHKVIACDISADDTIVASVGQEQRLAFFDLSNGGLITFLPLQSLIPQTDEIVECCFGSRVQDNKRRNTQTTHFALISSTVLVMCRLDPYKGELQHFKVNLSQFQKKLTAAKFTTNGDFLILGTSSGDVALVNTATGTLDVQTKLSTVGINAIVVAGSHLYNDGMANSDGNGDGGGFRYAKHGPGSARATRMFIGSGDGAVLQVDVADHQQPHLVCTAKRALAAGVTSVSLVQPDGTASLLDKPQVLASTVTGSVFLVDLAATSSQTIADLSSRTNQTGNSNNNSTSRHSPATSTTNVLLVSDAVAASYDVIVSHPSSTDRFYTASRDGALRAWDLNSYTVSGVFDHRDVKELSRLQCNAMCIADGLEMQLSAWSDGCVRCHDLTNYKLLWTHTNAHRSPVTAICLSPSLKFFVTGSAQGEIKLWDIRSKELKGELKDHQQAVVQLQLFEDDKHLLSASKDRTVCSWDLTTMKRLTCHEAHVGPLTGAFLCRNQASVYTTGVDQKICQWDLRYREAARVVNYAAPGSDAYATVLRRSVDERFLVTGGTDQIVTLWEERMLQPISRGFGHSGTIVDATFTSDNKQILSCGAEGAAMVWNVYA